MRAMFGRNGVKKTLTPELFIFRRYEILSDFYKKHFVDLRVLDTTCDLEEVPPPKVSPVVAYRILLKGEYLMTQDL